MLHVLRERLYDFMSGQMAYRKLAGPYQCFSCLMPRCLGYGLITVLLSDGGPVASMGGPFMACAILVSENAPMA